MNYLATVTQKGQITLPKWIREILDVDKYDTVEISTDESSSSVTIKKAPDIVDMAGTLKVDKKLLKKYPIEKLRDNMEKEYARTNKSRLGL